MQLLGVGKFFPLILFESLYIIIKLHAQASEFLESFSKIEVSEEKVRNFGVEALSKVHNLSLIIKCEICM